MQIPTLMILEVQRNYVVLMEHCILKLKSIFFFIVIQQSFLTRRKNAPNTGHTISNVPESVSLVSLRKWKTARVVGL